MKAILTISLWFSLIVSGTTKPPIFLSYQDSIGQYSFGYSDPMSARSEYRASDGVTRGTYSYIDKNGVAQTAEYEASKELGFRIKATNLPEAPLPVQDTPDVKAAREKHLQLLDEAKRREDNSLQYNVNSKIQRFNTKINTPVLQVASLLPTQQYEISIPASSNQYLQSLESVQRENPKMEVKTKSEQQENIDSKPATPSSSTVIHYEPIRYTPEVIAAREAHFRAYENAAKLAVEADLNPKVLMQYYMNEADRAQSSANKRFENENTANLHISDNKLKNTLLSASRSSSTSLTTIAQKNESLQKESLLVIENKKLNNAIKKLITGNLMKIEETKKLESTQNSSSMISRGMDARLPSLNEFEQTKLKAGAYFTPIEISHLSSTNLMPILYSSFIRTPLLQYVYL